mmetsp:Transcript_5752/g.10437  ORF Transcript_5752/g.10437 Transcript_5752/m.10437 type:complete len:102 (+) Transcript_5752:760-1065(+)
MSVARSTVKKIERLRPHDSCVKLPGRTELNAPVMSSLLIVSTTSKYQYSGLYGSNKNAIFISSSSNSLTSSVCLIFSLFMYSNLKYTAETPTGKVNTMTTP